jgi:hypothetical protein
MTVVIINKLTASAIDSMYAKIIEMYRKSRFCLLLPILFCIKFNFIRNMAGPAGVQQ